MVGCWQVGVELRMPDAIWEMSPLAGGGRGRSSDPIARHCSWLCAELPADGGPAWAHAGHGSRRAPAPGEAVGGRPGRCVRHNHNAVNDNPGCAPKRCAPVYWAPCNHSSSHRDALRCTPVNYRRTTMARAHALIPRQERRKRPETWVKKQNQTLIPKKCTQEETRASWYTD